MFTQKSYSKEQQVTRIEPERTYKILAVDDEPIILNLIRKYFDPSQYIVNTTSDPLEAMKIIDFDPDYDLVVLDLMMPNISGYDICRRIREKFTLFELPIIILTARTAINEIIEAFNCGANDYISKPFDKNEFLVRAQTLIKLKRLTKANNMLQEAVEIKNKYIQMTIHDLRNPLTIITGLANLLKQETENGSEHNEYLSLILESSELMLNMVNELLKTTRIESGKLFLKKEILDFNHLASGIVEKNRFHAINKKQNIIFIPEPKNKSMIYSDRIRIQEIMDNLISNAIKYSPKGMNIWVQVTHYQNHENSWVRFTVRDEGPGMSDSDKMKLFLQHERLSALPTGGEPSNGLGLSIVKHLIDLLGGRIWVESELNKGSTFVIQFPEKLPELTD